MQGTSLALAAVAALAAASSLSARQAPIQAASRPRARGAAPRPGLMPSSRRAHSCPERCRRGTARARSRSFGGAVLEGMVDPNETGEADEDVGLYHVTANLSAVMAEGRLHSRKELRRANRQPSLFVMESAQTLYISASSPSEPGEKS